MKLRLIVLFTVCFIAGNLFAAGEYTITAHDGDGSGVEAFFDAPVRARARLARTAAHLAVSIVPTSVANLTLSISPDIDFDVISTDSSAQSAFSLAARHLAADINTVAVFARLGGSVVSVAYNIDTAFAAYHLAVARIVARAAAHNRKDNNDEVVIPGVISRH